MKKKFKKAIGATLLFIDKRWQELTLCFLVVSIAVLAFACFGWASPSAKNEISAETISDWGLSFGSENTPPQGNVSAEELKKYNAYFIGDEQEKKIYLTFDAGYENGYTEIILDILKKTDVKATFFLVGHYLKTQPELVSRMVNEGHIVANHTYSHPDMSEISDKEAFRKELSQVETLYNTITTKQMLKLYRPPQGKFSVENLKMAQEMGYTTTFWSLAYLDWDNTSQPDPTESIKKLNSRIHNGAIVLLHSTSKTNSEILETLINDWKEQGYTFGTLDEFLMENNVEP